MGLNYKSIHVIGICGTFMAGVASLAKSLGYTVTGCDRDIYPPMSTYLQSQGIDVIKGFDSSQLKSLSKNTLIIIGNVAKRGMPIIEEILNNKVQKLKLKTQPFLANLEMGKTIAFQLQNLIRLQYMVRRLYLNF